MPYKRCVCSYCVALVSCCISPVAKRHKVIYVSACSNSFKISTAYMSVNNDFKCPDVRAKQHVPHQRSNHGSMYIRIRIVIY